MSLYAGPFGEFNGVIPLLNLVNIFSKCLVIWVRSDTSTVHCYKLGVIYFSSGGRRKFEKRFATAFAVVITIRTNEMCVTEDHRGGDREWRIDFVPSKQPLNKTGDKQHAAEHAIFCSTYSEIFMSIQQLNRNVKNTIVTNWAQNKLKHIRSSSETIYGTVSKKNPLRATVTTNEIWIYLQSLLGKD